MRFARLAVSTLALMGASSSAALAQGSEAVAARRSIAAANTAAAAAFNVGNPVLFADSYAPEALFMPPDTPAVTGHADILKAWQGAWAAGVRNLRLTIESVIVRGDVAVETGSWTADMLATAPGGAIGHDRGKYVVVWQRGARGKWWIVRDIYNSDLPR